MCPNEASPELQRVKEALCRPSCLTLTNSHGSCAAQVFVLDRLLEEDGVTGDQYGPYDPAFVASERERVRQDKVRM